MCQTYIISRFNSNYFEYGRGLGFELRYESSDVTQWSYTSNACGGNFTTPNGMLTSPLYPANYPLEADCVYTISQLTNTFLTLRFHNFDLVKGRDYLEIRDGGSEESPLIGKLSGTDINNTLQTTQNKVWIK